MVALAFVAGIAVGLALAWLWNKPLLPPDSGVA